MVKDNPGKVNRRRVAIVDGLRTPFMKSGTTYRDMTTLELATACITELMERSPVRREDVDQIVFGAVVADIAGPDGIYGTGDDCTGGQNGFGDSIYDENGGGNSGTGYCSTVVQASNHAKPYEILEFRQR